MKKRVFTFVSLLLSIPVFGQIGYRYGASFIELTPDNSSLYYVQTDNKTKLNELINRTTNTGDSVKIYATLSDNSCITNSISLGTGNYLSEIYKDRNGFKIIILPRFAIKIKEGHDIKGVLDATGDILSIDTKEFSVYKADCTLNNAEEVLALNNIINKLDAVEWCEPMMIGELRKCNVYQGSQYYLKNTGQNGGTSGIDINVEPVWSFLNTDTTLVVAVLDDGVERNHEDLTGSVVDGMTIDYSSEKGDPINEYVGFNYGSTYYSGDEKAHGTACAGIIAAHNNSIGVRGVSSGVKILPINIFPYDFPTSFYPTTHYEQVAQAINWAYNTKGADIISCSWGCSESTYIANAFNNAMNYGRNGKGTVVVCASGNAIPYQSVVFPANLDGTLAVGAIDKNGSVWNYSCRGSSLDLVAPSGNVNLNGDIVTADRMGNKGYNPPTGGGTELSNPNYTQRFGGTSAACPQVAGVAALMLSANPNLTELEVRNILKNTAKKLSGMNGLNRTDDYGYGLVDAYKAVVGAYKLAISGPEYPCSSGIYSIANLPTGYTVDWSISPAVSFLNTSILTTNSPQQNQCTITNTTVFPWSTTLFAAVKNPSGTTVATLSKRIRNTFDLTFSQSGFGSYPSIPASTVVSNGTIVVNHKCWVTLSSPYFSGMTILHTGATPQAFEMLNGDITFKFSTVTSTQNMTILGQDGCKVMRLLVQVSPNSNIPIPMLSVSPNGEGFEVELTYEGDEEDVRSLTERLQDIEWELNIANAVSGEKVRSLRVKGPKVTVSTVGWKSGIYVLQGIVNGQECSKKVTVK